MSDGLAGAHVRLQDAAQLLNSGGVFQNVNVFGRLLNDVVPDLGK